MAIEIGLDGPANGPGGGGGSGDGRAGGSGDGRAGGSGDGRGSGDRPGSGDGRGSGDGAGHRARLAGPASVLVSTTDEIADAFDSAADILRRRLGGE
jgi:hypothetical protein